MNPIINELLNCIDEPVICEIAGEVREYDNGSMAAKDLAADTKVSYAIKSISVQNGKVCVSIVDRQPEIDESNKIWIAEEEKRTGVSPSFF